MLQLINPNAVQSTGVVPAEAVAASPLELSGEQAAVAFDLHVAVDDAAADALLAVTTAPAQMPAQAAEIDPERWLSSMLEQQAVQIEARESVLPDVAMEAPQLALLDDLADAPLVQALGPQDERTLHMATARGPLLVDAEAAKPVPALSTQVTAAVAATASAVSLSAQTPAESLSTAAADVTALPGLAQAPQSQSAQLQTTLKLHAPQARWGEQMLQSLRDSVETQINQRIQNATIRLDPPELGSLEIFLSHEGGRITVQLSAANADVARLLQQTSDRLRQELVAQNFVQVNVQVSADAHGGRQQGQTAQQLATADEPVSAAQAQAQTSSGSQQDHTGDVLVTV